MRRLSLKASLATLVVLICVYVVPQLGIRPPVDQQRVCRLDLISRLKALRVFMAQTEVRPVIGEGPDDYVERANGDAAIRRVASMQFNKTSSSRLFGLLPWRFYERVHVRFVMVPRGSGLEFSLEATDPEMAKSVFGQFSRTVAEKHGIRGL